MFSFNKSFAALVGLSLLVVAFAALLPPAGAAPADKGPRKFYLTQTTHNGSQAPTACATGFHMASLWEIFDPSNVTYDTALGYTLADSGSGPPTQSIGWIRTGFAARTTPSAAAGNCNAYTSADSLHSGTIVFLSNQWEFEGEIRGWNFNALNCANTLPVWCVQD